MEIYTYGSGEFIAQILEAVKMLTSGGIILSLLKVFLLVAFLSGITSVVLRGLTRFGIGASEVGGGGEDVIALSPLLILIRNAIVAAIGVYVFLSPMFVTDVIVEDRYDPVQSRVVTEVPYGIAFIGYASSVIGDKMGEAVEELITPVEAVRFRTGGGVGIGPKYINELFEILPPGSDREYGVGPSYVPTRGVLEAWFSECIYPKFALIEGEGARAEGLNAFSRDGFILNAPALLVPPFVDPNTPLTVQYYGFPDPNETTCANAASQIIGKWYNISLMEKWIARFSAKTFGTKEDDITIVTRVYDMVDRYFPSTEYGTLDKLVQLATLNTAYSAYLKLSAEYGSTGASDIARRKQVSSWIEMARMGTKALFLMRQVAEAAVYLFGAFLPVFIAVAGLGVLTKYVKAVFWLQLWIPLFVVFNAIADYHLLKIVDSISYCTGGSCSFTINFETVDKLKTETGMILGYIGLLSVSVPGIAWGIIQGAGALGGMASSVIATHEAGSTAAAATVQRTGALTGFTAGTMVASAAQAGYGQATSAGLVRESDKWGLGAVQNAAETELAHKINVRTPLQQGEISEALKLGSGALQEAGEYNIASSAGAARGAYDLYNAAKAQGLVTGSFEDFLKQKASVATFSSPFGAVTLAATQDGTVLSKIEGGNLIHVRGAKDFNYAGMTFATVDYTSNGNNVRLESLTRDPALLGQLAEKATALGLTNTAQDLMRTMKEIEKTPGSSARVVVEGDMGGNISNIRVDRTGDVSRRDTGTIDKGMRRDLTSWTKDGSYAEHHHGEEQHYYGVNYNTGNDTLQTFVDGNPQVLQGGYSEFFRGDKPHPGGRALVDKVAREMGGYAAIAKSLQTNLSLEGVAGIKFGGIVKKIIEHAGIKLDVGGGGKISRDAVDRINADTVAVGMQEYYKDLMKVHKPAAWRAQMFTNEVNRLYESAVKVTETGEIKRVFSDMIPDAKTKVTEEVPEKEIPDIYGGP